MTDAHEILQQIGQTDLSARLQNQRMLENQIRALNIPLFKEQQRILAAHQPPVPFASKPPHSKNCEKAFS